MSENKMVKQLTINVYEDGHREIFGFGWGPTPTIVFVGSHEQGERPWIVATKPYSISEIGGILAGGLDVSLETYDKQQKRRETE